jgi:sec-independent protein translocase protein TatC
MSPGEQVPGSQAVGPETSALDGLGLGTSGTAAPALDGSLDEGTVENLNGSATPEETDGEGGRMTLFEHLAELRKRVLICAGAIVLASIAGYFLYNPVLKFMTEPYRSFYHHHKNLVTDKLVISSPVEGFTTRIKVSLYIGLALAAPVWLWEMWRFVTPGLKRNEKRYAVPFVLSAMFLFSLGVLTAVLVWPKALDWLISASGSGVAPLFTPSGYVSLYLLICLVFGIVFLYPIVVVFLMLARVVPSAKWRKWRRPAIVILCAVAAIATPSNDPFTFLGMAIPLVIFYEVSILIGRLLKR